jgi:hypothetical protein
MSSRVTQTIRLLSAREQIAELRQSGGKSQPRELPLTGVRFVQYAVARLRHDDRMAPESRHITEHIDRTAADVYAHASDPANLPNWAPGLGATVEKVDGHWFVQTPEGRAAFGFAAPNEYGVLDHSVTLPSGEVVYVPMRVIADGKASEVVFTLRRRLGMTDDEFARDAELVAADLARLRQVLNAAATPVNT